MTSRRGHRTVCVCVYLFRRPCGDSVRPHGFEGIFEAHSVGLVSGLQLGYGWGSFLVEVSS